MTRCALFVLLVCLYTLPSSAAGQCCGDCDGDGTVSVAELVGSVNRALGGCGALRPVVSLSGVSAATAILPERVTEGRVELRITIDWPGASPGDRVLFSVEEPNAFSNRVNLVTNGQFLRWIVTESTGREVDLSVHIGDWAAGAHAIVATWSSTEVTLVVDGRRVEAQIGPVAIEPGGQVTVGSPAMSGTVFDSLLFLAAP